MKNIIKYIVCGAAALTLAANVQASTISGDIGFGGPYGTDNPSLQFATLAYPGFGGTISASSFHGDFAAAPITAIGFAGVINLYNPNPATFGSLGTEIFAVKVGTVTYFFNVTSESWAFSSGGGSEQLVVNGSGIFTSDDPINHSAAVGAYQLTFGNTQGSFTFQETTGTNIPDGGTTAALLGLALTGLGLLRRRLA